jgi:hypothetical protein
MALAGAKAIRGSVENGERVQEGRSRLETVLAWAEGDPWWWSGTARAGKDGKTGGFGFLAQSIGGRGRSLDAQGTRFRAQRAIPPYTGMACQGLQGRVVICDRKTRSRMDEGVRIGRPGIEKVLLVLRKNGMSVKRRYTAAKRPTRQACATTINMVGLVTVLKR